MNYQLGAEKDKKDNRDYQVAGITRKVSIPLRCELKEKFIPKHQDGRGSCTAQAQAHHKERQENEKSSARFIFALTKMLEGNKKYGAYTRTPFKVVNKYGACSDFLYFEPGRNVSYEDYLNWNIIPENCYIDAKQHKSKSYWRVNNNFEAIKQVIYNYKESVVFSMPWYEEFFSPDSDGVIHFNGNYNTFVGGHAMEFCGWTERGMKVKNSWGKSWGKNGYFYLPKELENMIWDAWCSLDALPEHLPIDDRYGEKRTWTKYLMEKSFAFNPWLRLKIKRLSTNREIIAGVYGFWSYEEIFKGKVGDKWLYMTKPAYLKFKN